jgi:hypothetical protein
MATGRSTKLTGAVGEFLVAAELCRRGLIATPFSGNVPHYDIIASGQFGGHLAIQVKAVNGATWQFDISNFVEIRMDGPRQVMGKLKPEPYPGLIYVLVALKEHGRDLFFILEWKDLQAILVTNHSAYLEKHGGVRPKAHMSTHASLPVDDVEAFEGRWNSILQHVVMDASGE